MGGATRSLVTDAKYIYNQIIRFISSAFTLTSLMMDANVDDGNRVILMKYDVS